MFDSLRDKFHTFQENITTTFKGLSSAGDSLNRRQVVSETVPVNLNAGTDILDKFQTAWAELHEISQENAVKAEQVDGLICQLHKNVEKQWKDVGQLACCIASLPEVVHNVGELSKKLLSVEELFNAVETALAELEDIMDTRDFQNRQLEQRFQLALYKEKKLASLESVRIKLAESLAEKVRRHEIKQEKLLRECQLASEENFKEDLKVYKETKTVPRIEFAKSKGANREEKESSALEDIVLEGESSGALDAFLNESKDSEVGLERAKEGQSSRESRKDDLEDVVLDSEDSRGSLTDLKNAEKNEVES